MTIRWVACELHTHTVHSDASHTLDEMATVARELELDWIALTDHNTVSGWAFKEQVEAKRGIGILPGLEWTTFYGHMLTLGANVLHHADWRFTGPDDIDEGIAGIHKSGGLAGIAHPFRIGSPICTGCYWEFTIGKWKALDYIEVWNGPSPHMKAFNQRAYLFWTELLNRGLRIPAVSGRDWHHSLLSSEATLAVTYLGVHEEAAAGYAGGGAALESAVQDPRNGVSEPQLLKAIRLGAVSVTQGPLLKLYARETGREEIRTFGIGEVARVDPLAGSRLSLTVEADFEVRKRQWSLEGQELRLCLVGSTGIVAEWMISPVSAAYKACPELTGLRWIRAELYGTMSGQAGLLAFTNCIYIEEGNLGL
ncbi:PHP domain-containing protein [Paenibacillus albidus]|uniref:CehA/McbA family metallohydrolase n=1 Tax=Paenibacillus albidus TaxID=2041023 RepID=UPI001BED26D9|nr:CehA/McbA family metallohydrolase [Paenibacillus albidus]MBT2287550.1 PHP domain-containing protein [Paenibacillus albidus]